MLNLMIVDDEYNIREGIAEAIDWGQHDINMVGTAVNGIDALEKIEILKPDIIITDIRMDDMEGIEFAEVLKYNYPYIKVIFLSGYDEFGYAQKAVEMNVFAYILKPVHPDEIVEMVNRLKKEIEKENNLKERISNIEQQLKSNINVLKDKFINDLIEASITSTELLNQRMEFLGIVSDKSSLSFSIIC